ncbi:FBD-associated F-box protein At5g56370-like [Actinidia eriantha]|uniref:FBD-associated F-box protein At5g56370-like n=1 Tax=Actinidia eriantha TaxID=165200 RepID=UPI00258E3A18|nr:FBD-associated F-box protein At5g56370-like [Actinidia eriantha]
MLHKRFSRDTHLTRKPSTSKERKSFNIKQLRINSMDLTSQRKPKRKVLYIAKKGARVRKKRKIRDANGMGERTDTVDRISELPEPIIHHILSFLRCPKDVTRTSVLSKKWRSIWASLLAFDFDQKSFKAQGGVLADFTRFVESSLLTRIAPLVCIQKFRLHMASFDSKIAHHIDSWLCAATAKNVKELEIYVEVKNRRRYTLPRVLLSAETLTSLKLYGCKLDNYNDIKLPNLLQLSIKNACINVDIIQSFISSCPWIADLRLIHCYGLDLLQISTLSKLDKLEVHECQGLKWVEIEVPNLQTFWYCGNNCKSCNIKLKCCKSLKSLTLKDTTMTDELFHDQISNCPVLEKLVLKECNALERITILSQKLKKLALIRCKKVSEVVVDAPNLHSFQYTGKRLVLFSMKTPELQEAKLYFESMAKGTSKQPGGGKNLRWLQLEEFLGKFNQSKKLKLVGRHDKHMLVSEELRDIRLFQVNDLKLEVISSSSNLEDILDGLLRTTHPETLSVVSPSNCEFLKLLHEKLINREENPSCCKYYSRKCWRHYLKDVQVGNKWAELYPWSPTQHRTTIKLEWTDG